MAYRDSSYLGLIGWWDVVARKAITELEFQEITNSKAKISKSKLPKTSKIKVWGDCNRS